MDATGRQDAIPKGVADDFARLFAEQQAINAELLRLLGQRTRLAILLALALLVDDGR